ncbi:MAG: two-component sensor histidine kinase [Thermoflavifilum sp.]|nr:two-component sensor histidine kinase [Thermoflavifilum sp.]MCL6512966.1 cell wall metabolism sensor histidine kinase WalK [Alicyclobacillus sp.]
MTVGRPQLSMFQRVRLRLTGLTVAIFLILYAASSIAVYAIVRHVVMGGIDARLEPVARYIVQHPTDEAGIIAHIPRQPAGHGAGMVYILVHTPTAELTNAPADLLPILRSWAPPAGADMAHSVHAIPAGDLYRVLAMSIPGAAPQTDTTGAWVIAATDADRELHVLEGLRHVLWMVGVGGGLLAAVAGFYLAERALRPIRKAWQQQLEFVANASHELRTPLAVIRSNLDIVLEHPEQTVLANLEWINNAHSETRRLTKLVSDLLTLARTDSEQMPVAREPVDLTGLLQHIEELFEVIAADRNLTLISQIEPDLHVQGDRDRLHQLFVILLDNACKFTPAGGRIEIRAQGRKPGVLVEVSDTGIGIAEQDLPRVFERFYRADKARARDTEGGAGLGLSIARWIVDAHHGRIWITSRPGEGTTVHVQLPPTTVR